MKKVLNFIKSEFNRKDATLNSHLYNDLSLDPNDVIYLGLKLEEKYGSRISDDCYKWNTVEDVCKTVSTR